MYVNGITGRFFVQQFCCSTHPTSLYSSRKSLASDIAKKNPEVVDIHLGQADVLNKTPRNTEVQGMERLVQNLLNDTKVKI